MQKVSKEVVTMSSAKHTIPGEVLYKIAHASETAENVFLALGIRERIRDFSNINSLKYELRREGLKIVEADYMKMWKDWQDAGLGTIVLGRGKKQTKFIHNYDMRKIAQSGLTGKDLEVDIHKKEVSIPAFKDKTAQLNDIAKAIGKTKSNVKSLTSPPPVVAATPKAETLVSPPPAPKEEPRARRLNRVFISLREDVLLDIKLPEDITSAEVDKIRESLNRLVSSAATRAA